MRMISLFGAFGFVSACTGTIESGNGSTTDPMDVQIVVRDGALPQAGVEVIFQNADDTVVADVMTDAEGRAGVEMPGGGNLTVIRNYPLPPEPAAPLPAEAYTYVGVKPGDRLVLVRPISDQAPASAINVIVSKTATGTVKVATPCGSGQGTAPIIPVTIRGCTPDAFYVTANQASFFAHAPFSENVDISTMSLRELLSSSVSATNVAPNTTVTFEQRIESGGFLLYTSGAKRVDTTPATLDLPQIDGVEQVAVMSVTDATNRTQVVAVHSPYASEAASVDASVGLIASVSDKPTFTPTGITWVEASPGAPDLVISSLAVTRGGPQNPNNKYVRTTIAPYAGTSLRLPVLPGAALLYNPDPKAGDQIDVSLGLAKVAGGYDAIRASAFTVANLVDATPMNGQLTLSYAGTRRGF
jgi:hypothetical protein